MQNHELSSSKAWKFRFVEVVQVFSQAGLSSPVIGSIIVGVVNLVGTGIAVTLMDKLGRRPLLIFSHAGMAICLVSMSVTKYLHGKSCKGQVWVAILLHTQHQVHSLDCVISLALQKFVLLIVDENIVRPAVHMFCILHFIHHAVTCHLLCITRCNISKVALFTMTS